MWCILPQHWSALPRRAACTHVAPKGSQLCWCKYILTRKLSFLGVQSFDMIPQRNLFCYKNNNFQLIIDGRWLASSLSMSWQRRKQDSHVRTVFLLPNMPVITTSYQWQIALCPFQIWTQVHFGPGAFIGQKPDKIFGRIWCLHSIIVKS